MNHFIQVFQLVQREAVFAELQGAAVVDLHGIHHAQAVRHRSGLIAAVHGQLGQADVGGGDGDMGNGDIAQGAAAGDVGAIIVGLDIHASLGADLPQQGSTDAVGAVLLVGVELQHHAAAQHRRIGGICQLGVVGVNCMGIVRRNHEGLGNQLPHIPAQAVADAAEHIAEDVGVSTMVSTGTDLLAVEGAEDRDILAFGGIQEALERPPDALQIVQSGRGQELLVNAPDAGLFPDVEIQVMADDLAASLGFQQLGQLAVGVLQAQQGLHIHSQIPLIALVGLTVHVNGHIGDQQQVPVNVHQPGLGTVLGLHHHPSGNGQGAVRPGEQQGAAVALHAQTGIDAVQLAVLLHLEGGAVGMTGADQEALGGGAGQAESHNRRIAPADEVFAAGNQIPLVTLGQLGIAVLRQVPHQVCLGMIGTVGGVQKFAESLDSVVHDVVSSFFFIILIEIFHSMGY